MNWSEDETTEALESIFGQEPAPLPSKKRERPIDEAVLRNFLEEADARIGQNAIYAHMKSKAFQDQVKEAVQKEVERLRPAIVGRLEATIRKEMQEELRVKIQSEIEEEAEEIKRQSRSKATKSIFVYDQRTRSVDDDELLGEIMFN